MCSDKGLAPETSSKEFFIEFHTPTSTFNSYIPGKESDLLINPLDI